MRDVSEAAFLRSIAENKDMVGRLALADWLEERGESPRAEFIRVQCELMRENPDERRRQELRIREYELLVKHRREWVKAFGLPMEDVHFEGGTISAMKLTDWQAGRILDPEYAPWLATLTELDLSGLQIRDSGLADFVRRASFPALRELNLSGNALTPTSVNSLATCKGTPRLETLDVFGNDLLGVDRSSLTRAPNFKLKDLDFGDHKEGYSMSPGQTELARRQYIREYVQPRLAQYFQNYPLLKSAMFCVAQYWADEASDAVHCNLIVSELLEPTLIGVRSDADEPDPNLPNTRIVRSKDDYCTGSMISLWDTRWDDNGGAIPIWAPFAPEGGSQEYQDLSEAYAPAVMFYRHGGYEFLPMARPHLDGIRPEEED